MTYGSPYLKRCNFYTQSSLILHTSDVREVHALHPASSCLEEDCLKNFNNPIKYSYNCMHVRDQQAYSIETYF